MRILILLTDKKFKKIRNILIGEEEKTEDIDLPIFDMPFEIEMNGFHNYIVDNEIRVTQNNIHYTILKYSKDNIRGYRCNSIYIDSDLEIPDEVLYHILYPSINLPKGENKFKNNENLLKFIY